MKRILHGIIFLLATGFVFAQDRTNVGTLSELEDAITQGKTEIQLTAEIIIEREVYLIPDVQTTIYSALGSRHFTINTPVIMYNLVLKGETINNNKGGSIFITHYGDLTMDNCALIGNKTTEQGGAIYINNGILTMRNCSLIDNKTTEQQGGAIYQYYGYSLLIDCNLSENEATSGGAIFSYKAELTTVGCSFTKNIAVKNGGALYSISKTFMNNCLIADNKAGGYSAIDINAFDCVILNTTISSNESESDNETGAAFMTYQNITILNSIITENKLSDGSIMDISIYQPDYETRTITMHNSIYGTASATTSFDPPVAVSIPA